MADDLESEYVGDDIVEEGLPSEKYGPWFPRWHLLLVVFDKYHQWKTQRRSSLIPFHDSRRCLWDGSAPMFYCGCCLGLVEVGVHALYWVCAMGNARLS
jgi:hypothetical protein